jgi:dihydroxyacid dehydratase/phosphogluconate dehydratase
MDAISIKRFLTMLSLAAVVYLSGCKKDTPASIVGTWSYTYTTISYPVDTPLHTDTSRVATPQYITFRADGSYADGLDDKGMTGTYTVEHNRIMMEEKGICKTSIPLDILELTDHQLKWAVTTITPSSPVVIYTTTLSR